MKPERWSEVRRLFEDVLDLPPDERATRLERAGADDPGLRAEVERLLAARASDTTATTPRPPEARALAGALGGAPRVAVGERIGRYTLTRLLASGGMGEVWEAEQEHPRRCVALKTVRAGLAGDEARARFRFEAEVLARLRHPSIASILEAGVHEDAEGRGTPWYALELVPEAAPLPQHARRAGLDLRGKLMLFAEVCDAVQHGHQNGVIHRDLKPGNILVGKDGRPKVIDFGVARPIERELLDAPLTRAGDLVGTLAFMAPEQLDGRVDVRADVYSLGVVLYELLTGTLPHSLGELPFAEALRVLREETPVPPGARVPGVPRELDWIAGQALEREPERRYASVAELADDVRRLLRDEPVHAGAPGAAYRARRFVRRHRVGVGAGALVLLSLVGGILGTTRGMLAAQHAEEDAREQRDRAVTSAAEADAAREVAEDAAARASAVTDFLVDVFRAPDPSVDGREVKVVDALDRAAARIERAFVDQPGVALALHDALARLHRNLGLYADAESQARAALELASRGELADEAERDALRLLLADVLLEDGRFGEAEDVLGDVLARAETDPSADATLVPALDLLGRLRQRQVRLDDAEATYRRAIALDDRRGEPSPTGYGLRSSLGSLLLVQHRLDEAEPLLETAVAGMSAHEGDDAPITLTVLSNLASLRYLQGRLDDCADLTERVYEARRRVLPPDHPHLLGSASNLAALRLAQGRTTEGVSLLREAYEATRTRAPLPHPDTLLLASNLALGLLQVGDRDGLSALVDALCADDVPARVESEQACFYLDNLAMRLRDQGQAASDALLLDLACRLGGQYVAMRTALDGPDSAEASGARVRRLQLLAARDGLSSVFDELVRERERAHEVLPADEPFLAVVDHEFGVALMRLGRFAEAEPVLLDAAGRLTDPAELHEAVASLVSLYTAWGRPEDAAGWQALLDR
ncbi:MAG: serine/threonine protein kinase [Planctomycetes bacterium]|nr:serine/threonine protein kinase [Planctomycetota bacterium]